MSSWPSSCWCCCSPFPSAPPGSFLSRAGYGDEGDGLSAFSYQPMVFLVEIDRTSRTSRGLTFRPPTSDLRLFWPSGRLAVWPSGRLTVSPSALSSNEHRTQEQ